MEQRSKPAEPSSEEAMNPPPDPHDIPCPACGAAVAWHCRGLIAMVSRPPCTARVEAWEQQQAEKAAEILKAIATPAVKMFMI
jgi:hypothetical protein